MINIWTRYPLIEHNDFSRHDFENAFSLLPALQHLQEYLLFLLLASLILASKLVWTSLSYSPNLDRAM